MSFGIKLKVWGDFASFNRPEMKVERVSYDAMTPSAARGLLEAIYWKPQMRWVIDCIRVLNPIRFTQIRRNELGGKIPVKGKTGVGNAMKTGQGDLGIDIAENRQQRAALVLRDVCFGIEAHLDVVLPDHSSTNPAAKHLEMFKRRASRGQYFHHPYLGTREFPASFELVEDFPACHESLTGEKPLGWMLHDMEFVPDPKGPIIESNTGQHLRAEPRFFQAQMVDGCIHVPPLASGRA
jgi:CRISPR-associated protein Cas5d